MIIESFLNLKSNHCISVPKKLRLRLPGVKTRKRLVSSWFYNTALSAPNQGGWGAGLRIARMCAKSFQSCPTRCDPMDCSPLGSSPWDSPGKNIGVGYRALLHGIFPIQGLNPCLMSPALAGRFFTTSATRETLDYALLLIHHIFPTPNQDTWQEVMYLKETTEYGIFEIKMVTENLGTLGDLTTASISILPDI